MAAPLPSGVVPDQQRCPMIHCAADPDVRWTVLVHGPTMPIDDVTIAEVRLAGRILLELRRAGAVVAYVQGDSIRLISRYVEAT